MCGLMRRIRTRTAVCIRITAGALDGMVGVLVGAVVGGGGGRHRLCNVLRVVQRAFYPGLGGLRGGVYFTGGKKLIVYAVCHRRTHRLHA